MDTQFVAGRYACAHIKDRQLLLPGNQARLLLNDEHVLIKNGVLCVPYQNQWVPVYGFDRFLHLLTPDSQFVLVLDNGHAVLALACDQLSWVVLDEPPDAFPSVLSWPGCPIAAIASKIVDQQVQPVWVSDLSHIWQSVSIQSERHYESERLAG